MRFALICSAADPAGMNIRRALLQLFPFEESGSFAAHPVYRAAIRPNEGGKGNRPGEATLITLPGETIHAEHLDRELDAAGLKAEVMVFCTRHLAQSGIPTLTCHVPGNWGSAEMGGAPRQLCCAPVALLRAVYHGLRREATSLGWTMSLEATHHGPALDTPALFAEIGSGAAQWGVPAAGDAVARAVMAALESGRSVPKAFVVLGGGHYSQYAEKLMSDSAASHICPKHALAALDEEMLRQSLARTDCEQKAVLLDWKGLGGEKRRILDLLASSGFSYERSDTFF